MNRKFILIGVLAIIIVAVIIGALYFPHRENKKLRRVEFLLDWKAGPEYLGPIVAKEKGYYEEQELDVHLVEGTGAVDAAKLIAAGTHDIGISSAAAVLQARVQGAPLVSLAVIFQKSPVVIYSLQEKNITKPSDLQDKKLGALYRSSAYIEYKAMMKKQGIPLDSVQEVGVGFDVQPLLVGQVDAIMGYTQNQPNLVRLAGREVNQIFVEDWGVNIYNSLIAVNEGFLREEEELVRKLVRATLKGWQYSLDNTEEAIQIVLKAYPLLDEKFVRASTHDTLRLLGSPDVTQYEIGYQNLERWQNLQQMLLDQDVIKKTVDVESFVTNRLLETKPI